MTLVSNKDNPLVSCAVISYNSATTIIETLESIKEQSYHCIELIISDDGSKDNTIEVCSDWLNKNSNRFVRTELLTTPHNTGIPANANRAVDACQGEWLKLIAADDKMLPNCIEDCMDFVNENPNIKWFASMFRKYRNTFDERNFIETNHKSVISFCEKNVAGQLKMLAWELPINASTLFFKTAFKKEVRYDINYFHEDEPFYVNALEQGEKCYFLEKETVCYRVHESASITNDKLFNYKMLTASRDLKKDRLQKYLTKHQIRGQRLLWMTQDIFEHCGLNKKKRINKILYYTIYTLICRLFHPTKK
jgi:alpha-1,3-rhamnosyltransferase